VLSALSNVRRQDHPRVSPEPLVIDLRRVVIIGMALWAVAAVVCGVLWWLTDLPGTTLAVCGTGVLLGLVGLSWERRHR
jgi:hypothetical protein